MPFNLIFLGPVGESGRIELKEFFAKLEERLPYWRQKINPNEGIFYDLLGNQILVLTNGYKNRGNFWGGSLVRATRILLNTYPFLGEGLGSSTTALRPYKYITTLTSERRWFNEVQEGDLIHVQFRVSDEQCPSGIYRLTDIGYQLPADIGSRGYARALRLVREVDFESLSDSDKSQLFGKLELTNSDILNFQNGLLVVGVPTLHLSVEPVCGINPVEFNLPLNTKVDCDSSNLLVVGYNPNSGAVLPGGRKIEKYVVWKIGRKGKIPGQKASVRVALSNLEGLTCKPPIRWGNLVRTPEGILGFVNGVCGTFVNIYTKSVSSYSANSYGMWDVETLVNSPTACNIYDWVSVNGRNVKLIREDSGFYTLFDPEDNIVKVVSKDMGEVTQNTIHPGMLYKYGFNEYAYSIEGPEGKATLLDAASGKPAQLGSHPPIPLLEAPVNERLLTDDTSGVPLVLNGKTIGYAPDNSSAELITKMLQTLFNRALRREVLTVPNPGVYIPGWAKTGNGLVNRGMLSSVFSGNPAESVALKFKQEAVELAFLLASL